MTDEQIRALAGEALTIARRIHADFDRLGEILAIKCDEICAPQGDAELWRQRRTFNATYFDYDDDRDVLDEIAEDRDYELWGWARSWLGGGQIDAMPPLPLADEIQREIEEGSA